MPQSHCHSSFVFPSRTVGLQINQTFEATSKKEHSKSQRNFVGLTYIRLIAKQEYVRMKIKVSPKSPILKCQTRSKSIHNTHTHFNMWRTFEYTSICVTNTNHICKAIKLAHCSDTTTTTVTQNIARNVLLVDSHKKFFGTFHSKYMKKKIK